MFKGHKKDSMAYYTEHKHYHKHVHKHDEKCKHDKKCKCDKKQDKKHGEKCKVDKKFMYFKKLSPMPVSEVYIDSAVILLNNGSFVNFNPKNGLVTFQDNTGTFQLFYKDIEGLKL